MKITKDTAVTLRYRLTEASSGQLLEDGSEPSAYLHGGYGNIFPKVEAALEGQEKGFQLKITLPVEDAFGERDESLVRVIPKTEFPPGVKVGGHLEGRSDDGQSVHFRVVKIKGPQVHLDGNHLLAGLALKLDCTVLDVRAATAEEIAHGHVHGDGGHHH